jgi:pimeloyl-ACP methyl ester carboxylesterase
MPFIRTRDGIDLFYRDWGAGPPVLLIHGWPLNADMWEHQHALLAEQGFRVIAYDRRGFGRSSQPWTGYDYDTLSDDLGEVIEQLDLCELTLVGFSMGGGEVARYLSRHRFGRVSGTVLIGAVTPFLLNSADNPNGAPASVFEGMMEGIRADRPQFFEAFARAFYGVGGPGPQVSEALLRWSQTLVMQAGMRGTLECVRAFGFTDFRADMAAFTMPTLVIHGDADQIVPIDISGRVAAGMIAGAELKIYDGAPHGLFATHKDELNRDLLAFLRRG